MHHPLKTIVLLAALVLAPNSFANAESPEEKATIGRKLEGIEKATTFVKLLKNTDKAQSLLFKVGGTTTVFVPTNSAFEKMSEQRRQRLFDPNNKHWRERVLTYHALHSSRTDSYTLKRLDLLQNGVEQFLAVEQDDTGKLSINGTDISQTDLVCSNGIVHFIDEVLEPVELDLFEQLEQDGRFKILTKLITRSGLTKLFQNRHKIYTVFAPTDAAFSKLPPGTVDSLMSPEKLDLLSDVIRSHIAEGCATIGKIEGIQPLGTPGTSLTNQYQQYLIFRSDERTYTIDGRRIIESDGIARNGFFHVIDRPLLPKRTSLADVLESEGKYNTFLSLCREVGVYDLLGQFNQKVTVFAPTDSVFDNAEIQQLIGSLPSGSRTEILRGILLRHFVNRNVLTTNSISFRRFNSSLNGRLDFRRDGNRRTIQGVEIVSTDILARNGIAHGINGIIPGTMEDVDQDQTWQTYRSFIQETLQEGSSLYSKGELKRATDYYARRNYEFATRYGADLQRFYKIQASKFLNNDRSRNFRYDFAATAWNQRNGFRNLLRNLETKQPLLIDEKNLLKEGMNVIVIGNKAVISSAMNANSPKK